MRSNFWKRSLTMDFLKQFSIPFKGMLDGLHQYEFELDEAFFRYFKESPIEKAKIHTIILADKQGSLMTVELEIKGSMITDCDRCLSQINLPLDARFNLILKKAEGESDDPELYHIHPDASEWQIADLLYEYSCLSIPIIKEIDCSQMKNPPCNQEILKRIQNQETNLDVNPIWEDLKRLDLK